MQEAHVLMSSLCLIKDLWRATLPHHFRNISSLHAFHEFWPIEDHSFGVVPMGYHPVVGEPGTNVWYVWVYLAKHARWEKVK